MNPVQLALKVLRADSRSRVSAVFMALGVAVGVAVVLWLGAGPDAMQSRADRVTWRTSVGVGGPANPSAAALVVNTRDDYNGQRIERLDVAALKSQVPVAAGIPRLPGPGEVLLSPGLAKLAASLPPDQLADRFPGKVIGQFGDEALRFPDELVAMVGHKPAELPGGSPVDGFESKPGTGTVDELLVLLTQIGLVVLVAPCLVLVASAARLTAARRERRLAALRLAGATPQQVVSMTAAETAIAAVVGTVLGIALDFPLRSLTALISWDGGPWFPTDFTPNPALLVAVAVLAPTLVVAAAVLGLRRVVSRPLGAAQQVGRKGPNPARLLVVVAAAVVFVMGLNVARGQGGTTLVVLVGLAFVAMSLVFAGPLVTSLVGKLFTSRWRSPATLLAGRRLRDDPKAAFRASAGVVLAVFTGSMALVMLPGIEARIGHTDGTIRDNVFVANTGGSTPEQIESLRNQLRARGIDAAVVPIVEGTLGSAERGMSAMVVTCQDAAKVFGGSGTDCQPGPAVYVPYQRREPLEFRQYGRGSERTPVALPAGTQIREYHPGRSSAVLIDPALLPGLTAVYDTVAVASKAADQAAVHTLLARNLPGVSLYSNGQYEGRADTISGDLRRATVIGLSIAAILGGVSAGVAAAGSVVDRRRTFGGLIAAGTPVRVLTRALRWEAMLPALVATVGASVAGVLVGSGLLTLLRQQAVLSPWLLTPVVLGLVVALLAAVACGPVLRKVTAQSYAEE
ncbi:FtsX-like permease family protein [Kutzneria albida]|uniref:ABC3 transporter permease C-terminal domain-containing protein n=1 Tax=Kutzneria albida DSM 43870 TaxID=1449976 RepID=W5W526_9PSEU|nr:FtsX-like permease family protein [Kutzneria albida]AHH95870.1 hypothetical protein KALB_2502 [Kutzneria albida DSM 43870]